MSRRIKVLCRKRWKNLLPLYAVIPPSALLSKELDVKEILMIDWNKVLGRTFRELKLIEHWGSGLKRMLEACEQQNIPLPKFEELDNFFRITLYPQSTKSIPSASWQEPVFLYLKKHSKINDKVAQEMCQEGLLVEISTSPKDPQKVFVLSKHGK